MSGSARDQANEAFNAVCNSGRGTICTSLLVPLSEPTKPVLNLDALEELLVRSGVPLDVRDQVLKAVREQQAHLVATLTSRSSARPSANPDRPWRTAKSLTHQLSEEAHVPMTTTNSAVTAPPLDLADLERQMVATGIDPTVRTTVLADIRRNQAATQGQVQDLIKSLRARGVLAQAPKEQDPPPATKLSEQDALIHGLTNADDKAELERLRKMAKAVTTGR
jgi:hypothetical protein